MRTYEKVEAAVSLLKELGYVEQGYAYKACLKFDKQGRPFEGYTENHSRVRFRYPGTERWATVGKRLVTLYRRPDDSDAEDFRTFKIGDLEAIRKEIGIVSQNLLAQMAAQVHGSV